MKLRADEKRAESTAPKQTGWDWLCGLFKAPEAGMERRPCGPRPKPPKPWPKAGPPPVVQKPKTKCCSCGTTARSMWCHIGDKVYCCGCAYPIYQGHKRREG